ncbi:hypothetical protein PGTUg99_020888 [Puccinia graminis f. sp. tritici]|uniref:Isochorismatase-like domain-containing protein n=1 Tax=Puccinia graminis f. sp. tritici TaxID=56615 RepID=A0A5B0SML1_PUCGR|nr:hypothetical protein PGTUg99_020888 [Puccinia graminis f. sp. tritici]
MFGNTIAPGGRVAIFFERLATAVALLNWAWVAIMGLATRFSNPRWRCSKMNQQQPLKLINAIILLCDMQERFRTKIFHFEHVEKMAEKMLKASNKLGLPILSTEQNPKALGGTVQGLTELLPPERKPLPKSQFSMLVPEIRTDIASLEPRKHVAILGIEAHICVLQTSLDLLRQGFHVHVRLPFS